jgi:hypothetical protein
VPAKNARRAAETLLLAPTHNGQGFIKDLGTPQDLKSFTPRQKAKHCYNKVKWEGGEGPAGLDMSDTDRHARVHLFSAVFFFAGKIKKV